MAMVWLLDLLVVKILLKNLENWSQKLSKSQKSKSKKFAKSKNPLKSRNLSKFDIKEVKSSFLTPNVRMAFNRLWLSFTQAPIFWYFDLKYYIWIETNVLDYVINKMLSQLTSETSINRIITKTDLK